MKITEKVFDSQLESLKDSVEQSSQMKSLLIPLVNKQRYVVNHDEILAQDKSHCLQTDMSSQEVSYDDYLRSIIAEPLTHALVNVSQYRPEDSIEYISKFLRDWAETSHYNNVIHNETKLTLTNIEIHRENCLLNHKHQKHDKLFKLKAQENIRNAMQLEYDRNLYHNSQWVQLIDMKNDDEREPASIHQHFLVDLLHQQQTQQQFKQNKTAQHIHYHETSTNTANEQQIRDEVTSLKNERGCGDTITLATYFSNLKNKLINCDP
ncbi:unnamed protein product [Didymodactylos carnosus]|nr:unnamed protein product [Didymodactylos carnosus]CAF4143504.1 unnamed protein product [Didymodactylos carnosus]